MFYLQVFTTSTNLLRMLVSEYVPTHKIPKGDTAYLVEKTLPILIQRSGDTVSQFDTLKLAASKLNCKILSDCLCAWILPVPWLLNDILRVRPYSLDCCFYAANVFGKELYMMSKSCNFSWFFFQWKLRYLQLYRDHTKYMLDIIFFRTKLEDVRKGN